MVRHKYLQQAGDERRESFKTFLRKELGMKPKKKPSRAPKARVVKKKEVVRTAPGTTQRRRNPKKREKFVLFPSKKEYRQRQAMAIRRHEQIRREANAHIEFI